MDKLEMEIPNVTISEEYIHQFEYDPAEDIVAAVNCLVCGNRIHLHRGETGPRICADCKAAIMTIRGGRL